MSCGVGDRERSGLALRAVCGWRKAPPWSVCRQPGREGRYNADWPSRHARSKVRLVGPRRLGVLIGVVVAPLVVGDVFRTDTFVPICPQGTPIGDDAFPRHGEDTVILNREFELQSLALAVAIERVRRYFGPFLEAARLRLHCSFVINEPITLDDVQRLR